MSESDPEFDEEDTQEIQSIHMAVGNGISSWASMEGAIIEIAASLIGTTPQKAGLIFYSIANFNVWLTLVTELFAYSPAASSFRSTWNKEAEELKRMNDIRVRLAHHTIWGYGVEAALKAELRPHRYDSRPKSKKHQPLAAVEILDFINKVLDTHVRLLTLADGIDRAISARATGGKKPLFDIFSEPELDLDR